jgi:hypothetical protein
MVSWQIVALVWVMCTCVGMSFILGAAVYKQAPTCDKCVYLPRVNLSHYQHGSNARADAFLTAHIDMSIEFAHVMTNILVDYVHASVTLMHDFVSTRQ